MPSLLERVGRSLTRKKPEIITSNRDSVGTALEGFEPVSPSDVRGYVATESKSPTTEKGPGVFQSFLRSKSPSRTDPSRYDRAPHLSLHLPELSEGGSSIREKLSIVFEQHPDPTYTNEVLAARRLTTSETLNLVQKTASIITQRGLETPGIFKSFWYSQSPQEQRKLLVLFLQTLSADPAPTTDEAKPSGVLETFDHELKRASPHDVAELFKWAIRHFRLEAASFGTSSDEYGWYRNFAEAERTASFPPEAYTTILGPLLPSTHLELLNAIFNFASSVASYAETNGVSGSKLTRSIGWWLLSERRQSSNGLVGFIQEWDTAARILEHLFLAYVRDQQRLGLMPKRLTQLVKSYPYAKQASPTDQYFLPRPKFTTQRRTALFVRVAVPSNAKDLYNGKPLQLLKDAIAASVDETSGNADYHSVWEEVKRQATEAYTQPNSPTSPVEGTSVAPIVSVSGLLTEHAIKTLTSAGGESAVTSPTRQIDSLPESPLWRSISPTRKTDGGFSTTNSTALTSPVDWDDFTGQGFGGISGSNSLAFSEFAPPPPRQVSTVGANVRPSTKKGRTSRRRSVDFKISGATNGHAEPGSKELPAKDAPGIVSEATEGTLELDEAFIDNWAQIILDKTVASAWPSFALYELRNSLTPPSSNEAEPSPTRIQWLVIETYVNPPSVPPSPTAKGPNVKRSSSQKSDRRRPFGFFASTSSLVGKDSKEDKTQKRKDHTRRASELSTDSLGVKIKEPSKSQVDVSAPPAAIAEEPEPTTPNPAIAEEAAKDVAAVFPKEAEDDAVAVAPAPATLAIPTTDGSRFVEGSSPGTIPETVTDTGDHDKPDSKSVTIDIASASATAAVIGTGAVAAAIKHKDSDDVPVPVSDEQQNETAAIKPTDDSHVSDELSQRGEETVPVNETIDSSAPPPVEAIDPAASESQEVVDAAQAEDGSRLEAARLEREQVEKEQADLEAQKAAEAEKARLEEIEQQRLADEKAALEAAEAARVEAEELERQRLAAEEEARVASEAEAERLRLEAEQLEAQRIAKVEAERAEQEAAEKARKEAEEAERQRLAAEQAAEAAEQARLEAEELERQRIAEEQEELEARRAAEEKARLEAEELERQRLAKEEEARLAAEAEAEAAEKARQEAEELERQRIAKEAEEEAARKAAEEERLRLEAEEAEKQRLAAEAEEAERQRVAAEAARVEAERLEAERLAQEAAEQARLEAEELERQRLAAEAERLEVERLAQEEAERARLEAEELERQRIAKEAEEEAARKAAEAEAAEKARTEAEELERQRLAQREAEEAAEKARLEAERIAKEEEEQRLAKELAEQQAAEAERIRLEELEKERLAKEQAEREAAEAAEKARLEAEEQERQRIAKEQEELEAQRAAEEKARLEAEELERQRLAKEEEARLAAETEAAEKARLEAEELERQRIAKEAEEEAARQAAEAEAARIAKEQEEREAAEAAEKARLEAEEQERLAKEQAEHEAAEKARLEAEELERERLAKEEEARLAAEAEAAEKARQEAEELERQRVAKEAEEEAARKAAEAEAAELEKVRLAKEQEEREAAEAAEKARLEAEEQERLAKEQAEREAAEAAEKARLEAEEKERVAKEEAEREATEKARLEAEEQERIAKEQADQEAAEAARIAEEQEKERVAQEVAEQQRKAEEEAAAAAAANEVTQIEEPAPAVDEPSSHEEPAVAHEEAPTATGAE